MIRFTMTRTMLLLILLTYCALALRVQDPVSPKPESGQRPEQTSEPQDDRIATIRIDTNLVLFDVKVVNSRGGGAVRGLKAEDFAVYEDGVKQQISIFSASEAPLSLALVLDTSGSTQSEVSLIRRAARRFLEQLRPQDRVAVLGFHQDVELLADLTSDRRRLERALGQIEGGSGTSFYDALALTAQDVLKRADGRKAIVVLTDGVDSFGVYTYTHVLPILEKSRSSAYFLELDTLEFTESRLLRECSERGHFRLSAKQLRKYVEKFRPREGPRFYSDWCLLSREQKREVNRRLYELAAEELREMAARTGGRVYPVGALNDQDRFYAQLAEELRAQYSIGYYPSNEKHDGKWRELRVEMRNGDWAAETRPGYRAPVD
ncbi:MAG: VWA domain-containing protein [Blastocatellales bacterium]|nr:VWA domain-containing protein [Blastocatellales bacterium]